MKLNNSQKAVIGVLTVALCVLLPYLIYEVINTAVELYDLPNKAEIIAPVLLAYLPLLIIVSILTVVLFIFYTVHTLLNNSIDITEKTLWILVFLLVSPLSYLFYWGKRVWPS